MSKLIRQWNSLAEPVQFSLVMIFLAFAYTFFGIIFSISLLNIIGFILSLSGIIYLGVALFSKKYQ